MSFKDDISEAKSKEFNYIHKANEDFADDIIESNTNCWSCGTDIPLGKKYCEYHCGHPADEFDSFTGQCKACGKSLNVNMMMAMPVAESKATEVKIERGNGSMTIDGKPVIKIWESFNGWYWYAVEDQGEYVGVGADGNDVEAHAWFGYVQADFNEWGTFDSKELERAGVWEVPRSNWAYTGRMEESKASESDGMQVDWWDSLSQDERSNWMNSFSMTPTDGSIYMDNYDEMDSSNQYYVKSLFRFVKDNMNNDLLGRNHDIFESKASEMMLSMKTSQLIHPSDNNKYGSPDRAVRVTLKWNEDSETGEQSNVELLLDDNVIQTFSDRKEGEQKYREITTDRSGESKANEGFIKDMNLNKDSLRNYDLNSLINMWKDAQAYYQNPDNTWEDEDAEFYDELAVVINEKKAQAGEMNAKTLTDNWFNIGNGLAQCKHCTFQSGSWSEFAEHLEEAHGIGEDEDSDFVSFESSEDVIMYEPSNDPSGVGFWWDFESPMNDMKHEQISSLLGIDHNKAWAFLTKAEQDRVSNYKLNKVISSEKEELLSDVIAKINAKYSGDDEEEEEANEDVTFGHGWDAQDGWTDDMLLDRINSGNTDYDHLTDQELDAWRRSTGQATSDIGSTPIGGRGSKHNNYSIYNDPVLPNTESNATEDSPCWDGYEQIGMKEKDGKQVPNCVPKDGE